ncbi:MULTISPECIES: rhomboid family intramembrane serine protease [unclassified Mucilaginibacter]|nr:MULTISPECIES: rhomboid family intramembrane serine protease [unclassified Mucilaginibacter]MEB0248722.1 rhomboid family intramembrane serine protease [Mucilaginibacter sp. 5B2]MEB0260852.1 rhomboid family intramembrane serine protease [Mucilaginibacter sp. 10I4]MEB0278442.1 rhomboid family intramembrane serine protease [Mucilaginibacter sp. 10B2]MEB0301863.1 rhomboid family intramembrane serine protease [Mucilaginibacter sp. 5C4]WPX25694.1 rhomboid family intramembrane serine protease [Muci
MEIFLATPVASIIFVITLATSLWAFSNENIYGEFILNPYNVSRGHKVYTVITSGLIHKDWNHLFFNMLSYYFFAFQLEAMLGHWQFGLLYVLSLILSDLPSIQKHKDDIWYNSLGASGAISAVIFSFIMFNPKAQMGLMFIPIPIPAWIFGVLYLVYCHFASKHARDNVNHDAHLYGAVSGVVITFALHHEVINEFIRQF